MLTTEWPSIRKEKAALSTITIVVADQIEFRGVSDLPPDAVQVTSAVEFVGTIERFQLKGLTRERALSVKERDADTVVRREP